MAFRLMIDAQHRKKDAMTITNADLIERVRMNAAMCHRATLPPTSDLMQLAAPIALLSEDAMELARRLREAEEIVSAAADLVSLWKAQKISGVSRADRNAAIEESRQRLIDALAKEPIR